MSMASQSSRLPPRGSVMDADFDLSVVAGALWRNKGKILRPTIAVALITFAVVMLIPPKYLGESRVLIVGRDNVFLRPDADRDNACMRFLPGSHHHGKETFRPSDPAEHNVLNQTIENVERFGEPVDVELKAGEISVHCDLLLHGSEANNSNRRRCGLTQDCCARC